MFRVFIHYHPTWLLEIGLFALAASISVLSHVFPRRDDLYIAIAVVIFLIGLGWAPSLRHAFDFGVATRGFRTLRQGRIKLRYPPGLASGGEIHAFMQSCQRILTSYADQFGLSLSRILVIYMFAEWPKLYGIQAAHGLAFERADMAVVVFARDNRPFNDATIRHELAHLFGRYLGPMSPQFKNEGLAMALGERRLADFDALLALLRNDCRTIRELVKAKGVTKGRVDYGFFAMAGSFTRFLIGHFGWDSYCKFYRLSDARNFCDLFAREFGINLDEADQQWRTDLLAKRDRFQPELGRALAGNTPLAVRRQPSVPFSDN
jgi:hypothetical protein